MKRKEPALKTARKKDDIEFEIDFYEKILKDAPDFIEALSAIGDLYTKSGHWQKGLAADLRLFRLRPDDSIVLYNLACSYALLNQTSPALSALTKAVECGYVDFTYLRNDVDLENLLKDKHMLAFIKELERKKKKVELG